LGANSPLKILMVSADFSLPPFGGIAAHLAGLCPELVKQGHQVTLALPGFHERWREREFKGVDIEPVGKTLGIRFVRYFTRIRSARRALARLIDKTVPDIIHAHDLFTGPPVARVFADKVRYVVTNHTSLFPRWAGTRRGRFFLRRLYGRPQGVIAVSPLLMECSRVLKPERIEFIPNGVDTTMFRPQADKKGLRESLGIAHDAPVVLFAGRFHPVKGLEYLPAAMRMVLDKSPTAKLVIIGGGSRKEEADLATSLAELDINPATINLGRVPHEKMPAYYALADLLVLPSLMEGISVAALEAMACAVPAVATAVGGMPEVIEDGVSGRLVPPRSPESLAEAMIALLEDRESRLEMGAAARRRVEERFAWVGIAERTVEFYRQVIEHSSRAGR
jgi:glycosyltransferase involved in cell wall biosynthesis